MCAIGTWAAFSLDTTVTYSLTALALISFVGSVSVARFRVRDIDSSRVRDIDSSRVRDNDSSRMRDTDRKDGSPQ